MLSSIKNNLYLNDLLSSNSKSKEKNNPEKNKTIETSNFVDVNNNKSTMSSNNIINQNLTNNIINKNNININYISINTYNTTSNSNLTTSAAPNEQVIFSYLHLNLIKKQNKEKEKQPIKTFNFQNIKTLNNNITAFTKKLDSRTLSSNLFNKLKLKNFNKNKTSSNFDKNIKKIKETPILSTESNSILSSNKSLNKLYTNPGILKTWSSIDFETIPTEKSNFTLNKVNIFELILKRMMIQRFLINYFQIRILTHYRQLYIISSLKK